jgi:GntR family transcriptional regulator
MTENRFSTRPLYLQLREALLERIAAGEWKAGGAIPNEADLAREFGVSPGTMRKALDLLETQRVLTRRQGRGTFVNDQSSAEMALRYSKLRRASGQPLVSEIAVSEFSQGAASEAELLRLGLEPEAHVYRYRRTYVHEGRPFMVDKVVVPANVFPGLENQKGAAYDVVALARRYGLLTGNAAERISMGVADESHAPALNVAPGAPLLIFDRVVFELSGLPLEWRLGYCHLASGYYLATLG